MPLGEKGCWKFTPFIAISFHSGYSIQKSQLLVAMIMSDVLNIFWRHVNYTNKKGRYYFTIFLWPIEPGWKLVYLTIKVTYTYLCPL